ncbi:hypothetical protein SE17_21220 [Kouleothrix aurantiaca]|jgi:uncharacterized repeat protein (TIGR03847 family)|uniref:DUF3090 domain-containing protein n=1 Tax=Kouleothrix aurantiaca TaxID=186479 RepID=A0A0P9D7Z6_9CHLR|nr:hypothetical protein SE17_21220 [Kouleothrix aurantiaca]
MPDYTYELDPVSRITANAVGEPGKRVFYIQARRDRQLVSLICEKEQVRALAQHITQLLEDLTEKNPLLSSSDDMLVLASDMSLEEPLESRFRIAQMGIGYDADRDMIILLMQGSAEEEGEDAPTARFAATRQQMRALSEHAAQVVSRGRRICGNCGRPIDPNGHFCPQMN